MKVTLYKSLKPIVSGFERDLRLLETTIRSMPRRLKTPELMSIKIYMRKCFQEINRSQFELDCILKDSKSDLQSLVLNDITKRG